MWRRLCVCLSWWQVAKRMTCQEGGQAPPISLSFHCAAGVSLWLGDPESEGERCLNGPVFLFWRPVFQRTGPRVYPLHPQSPGLPCTQWEAPSSGSPTVTDLDLPSHLEGTLLSSATQPVSVVKTSVSKERWPNSRLLWASVFPPRMTYLDWSSSFQAFV